MMTGAASASTVPTILTVLSCQAGIAIERWLFFAEARHKVTHWFRRAQE